MTWAHRSVVPPGPQGAGYIAMAYWLTRLLVFVIERMWTQGRVDESRVCNNHRAGTAREISDAVILGYKALVPRNVQPQALRD